MGLFTKRQLTGQVDKNSLPRHVAVIMDGNGRCSIRTLGAAPARLLKTEKLLRQFGEGVFASVSHHVTNCILQVRFAIY